MDLAIIKQILRMLGISNLRIRFDVENRQIIATFISSGEMRTECLNFTDIEDLFTDQLKQTTEGITEATGRSRLDESSSGG